MADKSIGELVAATAVGSTDLFVLEQTGTAKKLTGQILENWLVSFADGHGGIQSIEKTGSTGTDPVVDSYTITLADQTTYVFTVTNGLKGDTGATGPKGEPGGSITSIVRTSGDGSPGTTDEYTAYVGEDAVGTFTVYNGTDGDGAPGTAIPLMDGVAASGVSTSFSRQDHVHPTDTSRAAAADLESLFAFNRTNANLVCFGDSWTMGTGIAMEDRPTKRFTAIIAKKLNCTEFNFGVGASGFIRTGNLISTQIATASSTMTAEQINNTRIVLIVGGVNDYRQQLSTSSVDDFVNGVINTATLAHGAFPNAVIVLGIGDTNVSYFPFGAKQWYKTAIDACESQLDFPSVIIKNLYNVISGDTSLYNSDGLHPNESGHALFGGYISNAILGGGQTVLRCLGAVSLVSPASTENGYPMGIYRLNDEIVIEQRGFAFSSAITSNTVIGSIPPKLAPSSNAYFPYYYANAVQGTICITASGSVRVIPNSGASISAGYSSQIRYIFGRETNTDES